MSSPYPWVTEIPNPICRQQGVVFMHEREGRSKQGSSEKGREGGSNLGGQDQIAALWLV